MAWKSLAAILIMFASTQALGVAFQYVAFEIEKQGRESEFSRQASESFSPYRGSEAPLIALPLAFVAAIYFYLFAFRFRIALKLIKLGIYAASILSFALATQIIAAFALSALPANAAPDFVLIQQINFLLSLAVPSALLVTGRYKTQLNNVLGICLCAMLGYSLAAYFTLATTLALLFLVALLDYYFVLRNRKILRLVEMLEKYEMPFALESGRGAKISAAQSSAGEGVVIGHALGFGDLIFATALSASAFVDKDAFAAALTILFTTVSLGAFILLFSKKGKPMPAMPSIFVGGMVAVIAITLAM